MVFNLPQTEVKRKKGVVKLRDCRSILYDIQKTMELISANPDDLNLLVGYVSYIIVSLNLYLSILIADKFPNKG